MNSYWNAERLPIGDSEDEGLSALRIACSFPAANEHRVSLQNLLAGCKRWMERHRNKPMRREVLIQMTQLPRPEGSATLSRNASRWIPSLAMGVWPDREPPRSMTKRDFTHQLPGTKFPTFAYETRRVLAQDEDILLDIEEQMAGSGSLLEIIAAEDWVKKDALQISSWLKGHITDDTYRSYPFYVPLLDAATLVRLSRADRHACLSGIDVYMREDLEDECLLLITRTTFENALEMIDSAVEASVRA